MKSISTPALAFVVLGLTAAPLAAADGLLIVEKATTGGSTETHQIQIEKNRMRAESGGADSLQVVIFDGTAQVMRTIDYAKKTYVEMTKEDMDRLGAQMASAMAQMQEQMKNLPPAARAQMEAMMRGRGMAATPVKTEYRKTGTDKVGKWTCDKYEGYQNGAKVSELCTVDPSALGFTNADIAVTQQMADFFKTLMPQNADQMFSLGKTETQGFAGVPVRRVFTIGQRQTTSELTDVSRQTFPDSLFAVPAGFKKQTLGAPGR